MVVDDSPAVFEFSENDVNVPPGLSVSRCKAQLPKPSPTSFDKTVYLQIGKCQNAHFARES